VPLMGSEDRPRFHTYDETIKNLQVKDGRGLASLVLPDIIEAEEVMVDRQELAMASMERPDYLARVKLRGERFLLHVEFETNFRSNREMQRRMLRYYAHLYWNKDLPILQAVVILKEPRHRKISQGMVSVVLGQDVLRHQYRVVRLYALDKYDVLSRGIVALYPLRVFMRHAQETPVEHLKECLEVAEATADTDYYFLTVECGRKRFGTEILEKIVKEAMYVASALYKHPYEAGRLKGKVEGKLEGKLEGKTELVLKQLAKRFGCLPPEISQRIGEATPYQLDRIAEDMFDFRDLDDVLRCLL